MIYQNWPFLNQAQAQNYVGHPMSLPLKWKAMMEVHNISSQKIYFFTYGAVP